MTKKYATEEERKAAQRERNKKYYQANKEKILEYKAEFYQANKERITEQQSEYYQANRDKIVAQQAEYRKANKEKITARMAEYHSTPIGRATYLIRNYKQRDEKCNRGECTLTAEWIIENIFSKSCVYCGESDWHKLGCDRIDNSKPHTEDNVVPCCGECNNKRGIMDFYEFKKKWE